MTAGSSATRQLPFSAHPAPTTDLKFDDEEVRDTERVTFTVTKDTTTFTLKDAERADAGVYTVSLNNDFGTANVTITVRVFGEWLIMIFSTLMVTF